MRSPNDLLRWTAVMLERAGKKQGAAVWTQGSAALARPALTRVEVNLGRLSSLVTDGAAVFVPGKVLGSGNLQRKKLVVGAFAFSEAAKRKIEAGGGKALSIAEFVEKYPKGTGVKIVE